MNVHYLSSIKSLFAEALAEKPGSYVVNEIFSRFPSLVELMNVTEQELMEIKGIGMVRARQIIAALQLSRKLNEPVSMSPYIIRSPQDAADLLLPRLRYLQQEHFSIIFLNVRNHVIGQPETISVGSLNSAIVTPQMVFRAALKRSIVSSILCAHNHPSGDCTPSPEDIQLTKRLVEAGAITGIEVLDHLILGSDSWTSLKEQGYM